MKIIDVPIRRSEVHQMAQAGFGDFVKAVVDVDRKVIAVDAELHADLEALLLENGSKQASLWGINLYPEMTGNDFVEFDSMINVRPNQGNRTRGVESVSRREAILKIVSEKVVE